MYESIVEQSKATEVNVYWWVIMDMKACLFYHIQQERFEEWFKGILTDSGEHIYVRFEVMCTHGKGSVGHDQRNYALKYLPIPETAYVYFLDDDNILAPRFIEGTLPAIKEDKIIVVDQYLKTGQIRLQAHELNVFPGKIDTAQYLFPKGLASDIPFPLEYDGDGKFIHALHQSFPEEFVYINKPLSYYNYLR